MKIKLYDDNDAFDIKEMYLKKRRDGKTHQEVNDELIKFIEETTDETMDDNFWFGLADVEWDYGVLDEYVKNKALDRIENGIDIERYMDEEYLLKNRQKELEKLKQKLNSPMPKEKKVRSKSVYICDWKIGDVFAFKLESPIAKDYGYDGEYLILQMCKYHDSAGDIEPIVKIKITNNKILPKTEEEIEKLENVIIYRTYVLNGEEIYYHDIQRLGLTQKQIDEITRFGYYLNVFPKTKRAVPKKLIYLGNYKLWKLNYKEHIKNNEHYFSSCWSWIETRIIKLIFQFKENLDIETLEYTKKEIEFFKQINK